MELLERESYLRELDLLLDDAANRHGRILFLGGEAGVGKTSLIETFCRQVEHEVVAVRSSCDALSTPGPLSSIRPHASALGIAFQPHLREGQFRDDLFHAIFDALDRRTEPVLMVGEDAHWSDDASLDLIRYIGRRVDRLPLLLVITYRDDEIGLDHPLRRLLGDLVTAPGYRRMALPPLTEDAVQVLASGSGFDPHTLHRQTGGNPFYITEVLAAGGDVVPATVSDAVLARASRLSPAARDVLNTAAVIGARVDGDVLVEVAGPALDEIEECIGSGLLRTDGDQLIFRHQLARDAVYAAIIPPRRRLLHGRVLAALRGLPDRQRHLAALAHHAELAGDRDATLEYAIAAAEQASDLRAHREATQQYERALRAATDLAPERRADLLEAWSFESYLTHELSDAIAGRQHALTIWRALGNPLKEGENLRWLSRVSWFAGHNAEANEAAQAALTLLEPLPPGPQLAWAYSNMSQLRMLASDTAGAIDWGDRAIVLAERLGEREILMHALNNVGTARMQAGEPEGQAQVERSLELALADGLDDHVGRAWVNLASNTVMLYQLDAASRYLDDGIGYATEHDLDSYRLYLTAWRSLARLRRGDWAGAELDCETVLGQPRTVATTRIVALTTLGRLRARRGDPDAMTPLQDALKLAEPTGETLRLGPVRAALAEAAWLAGDNAAIATTTEALRERTSQRLDPWLRGEIAWLLAQAGATPPAEADLAEPYALQVAGDWLAAACAWDNLGCPYEAARARLASDDEAVLRLALAGFERLGATPATAMAHQRLREIGARAVSRGPNRTTRDHPAGLTAREAEILSLISAGSTNREIADHLYLSPKTVEHHVSAILAKLEVPTRRDAVRAAAQLGLGPSGHHPA
jgi:DNA-binding CsgD family transcriptional regulator